LAAFGYHGYPLSGSVRKAVAAKGFAGFKKVFLALGKVPAGAIGEFR
jgi:hypothetical protein